MNISSFFDSKTNTQLISNQDSNIMYLFDSLFFCFVLFISIFIILKIKRIIENPMEYKNNALFVAIISFISLPTSQSILSELNNTLELHNDSNIFNILIQLTFIGFISLFYTTGTAKIKSKSLVDNFQLSQGLIKHLETKNNKDKMELIKKNRVQILTKFPELKTNPLFKIKSDKLLIIEDEQ